MIVGVNVYFRTVHTLRYCLRVVMVDVALYAALVAMVHEGDARVTACTYYKMLVSSVYPIPLILSDMYAGVSTNSAGRSELSKPKEVWS